MQSMITFVAFALLYKIFFLGSHTNHLSDKAMEKL